MHKVKFRISDDTKESIIVYFNKNRLWPKTRSHSEEFSIECDDGIHEFFLEEEKYYKNFIMMFLFFLFGDLKLGNPEYAIFKGKIHITKDTVVHCQLVDGYIGNVTYHQFMVESDQEIEILEDHKNHFDLKYKWRYILGTMIPFTLIYVFLMVIFVLILNLLNDFSKFFIYLIALPITIGYIYLLFKVFSNIIKLNK